MTNVMSAFEFRENDNVQIGYKEIDCHMIFDIKTDLTRKARLVAGGHQTDVPKESVYSSVDSRDSVRIAFLIAALNGLDVLARDVQNAYLNAPTKGNCYTIAGPEFRKDNIGRPVLIVRALYGLCSSGARWRDHMASTLRDNGFKGCMADHATRWLQILGICPGIR
jgi:Reverse transcriptase (RNA-dependent DNA polymerase)